MTTATAGKPSLRDRVLKANAFHTPERGRLEVLEAALIAVDKHGYIERVLRPDESGYAELCAGAREQGRLVTLDDGAYLLPGLVDLHIHAPQWPQLGCALDEPLEVWLDKYTFPLEARYADEDFARSVYRDLVASLLRHGTTTAVYFATVHLDASVALAEICQAAGQRAFVGKLAMDDDRMNPDYYRDASAAVALADTRRFIDRVHGVAGAAPDALVQPVITPRFVPSCSLELLEGLGRLAAQTGCRVQTHCSESDWEVAFVRERHQRSDTEVLRDCGLLREHAVLAHANFVTDADMALIGAAGAAVAHCPLSNVYFAGAAFPLREALDRGLRVGLGTDISGGYSAFMLDSCRHGVACARARESGVDARLPPATRGRDGASVSITEAFWLASAGGAEALGVPTGSFAAGRKFDALCIDTRAPDSALRLWPDTRPPDVFQKIVLNSGVANIRRTWVDGIAVA